MNGMKIGKWDIMYCKEVEEGYKQNGGGSYDQEGNQNKEERFDGNGDGNKITNSGEYNMKGQKVGIWVEMDISRNEKGEWRYDNQNYKQQYKQNTFKYQFNHFKLQNHQSNYLDQFLITK